MWVPFVTTAPENGCSPEDVQRAAGHADPSTTRLYDRRGCDPEKSAWFFANYRCQPSWRRRSTTRIIIEKHSVERAAFLLCVTVSVEGRAGEELQPKLFLCSNVAQRPDQRGPGALPDHSALASRLAGG